MRMQSAGPQVMLDRLEEDWAACDDIVMLEELQTEKLLWALIALDSKVLSKDNTAMTRTSSGVRNGTVIHFEGSMGKNASSS
jgi:hypothetical protein